MNYINNEEYAEICIKHFKKGEALAIPLEMLIIKTGKEDILGFMKALKKIGKNKDIRLCISSDSVDVFHFKVQDIET